MNLPWQVITVRILTSAPIHHVSTEESAQMEIIHTHAHVNLDMKVHHYALINLYLCFPPSSNIQALLPCDTTILTILSLFIKLCR